MRVVDVVVDCIVVLKNVKDVNVIVIDYIVYVVVVLDDNKEGNFIKDMEYKIVYEVRKVDGSVYWVFVLINFDFVNCMNGYVDKF